MCTCTEAASYTSAASLTPRRVTDCSVVGAGSPIPHATGAILTRLFGGFAPDFPHYISGEEFKK
jgi:hypothetical protein